MELPEEGKYAVGFLFLRPDIVERENVQRHFERIIEANGRRVPVDIAGTERVVPAQLVLLAMGFRGSEQRLFDEFGLAKAGNGSIAADEGSYATSVEGVFAAGDARRGQSLVVWAIAEGRGAAQAVDKYLQQA